MHPTLATLLLAVAATGAQAAQFQLLIYETPAEIAKRSDTGVAGQAYWAGFDSYGKALQAAGVLRGGGALLPPAAARSVSVSGGTRSVAGVPDAQAGAQLGGWFVIDVPHLDAALAWAAQAPSATSGGAVQVRPLADVPGMAR